MCAIVIFAGVFTGNEWIQGLVTHQPSLSANAPGTRDLSLPFLKATISYGWVYLDYSAIGIW